MQANIMQRQENDNAKQAKGGMMGMNMGGMMGRR
jgi:hypothetical protein